MRHYLDAKNLSDKGSSVVGLMEVAPLDLFTGEWLLQLNYLVANILTARDRWKNMLLETRTGQASLLHIGWSRFTNTTNRANYILVAGFADCPTLQVRF